MKTFEILEAARDKIKLPENWMQGYYAKTSSGVELLGNEEGAVCFCGFGAIEAVTGKTHCGKGWPEEAEQTLNEAAGEYFPHYNDSHTHEEVLAVFNRAIEAAKDAV